MKYIDADRLKEAVEILKAEELMIGDWVYMKAHRGFDSQYIKVEYIPDPSSDTHYGHIGSYPISDDMDFRDIEDSHLEPIPLTQEILEKNGMKEFEHRNPWQGKNLIKKWYHKSGDYYVSLYKVGCEQSYTFGDGFRPTRICNIHYVHELQHALRMCGINKTIEL